jgi:hypothetical protein
VNSATVLSAGAKSEGIEADGYENWSRDPGLEKKF